MKLKHIQHLYWRAGFGILPNQLHALSKKNKNEVIDNLFRASKKFTPLKVDTSEIENILNGQTKMASVNRKKIQEFHKKALNSFITL